MKSLVTLILLIYAMIETEYILFKGVIKGSEPTLDTDKCYLSQQSYLALSERAQFMFSGQRDLVYELFLKYREKKRTYGDYDDADRYVYRVTTLGPHI